MHLFTFLVLTFLQLSRLMREPAPGYQKTGAYHKNGSAPQRCFEVALLFWTA